MMFLMIYFLGTFFAFVGLVIILHNRMTLPLKLTSKEIFIILGMSWISVFTILYYLYK